MYQSYFVSISDTFLFNVLELFLLFYIFSVTVSAKEGDGSIHAAIQTLVRHLLLKRLEVKSKDSVLKNFFNMNKKQEELTEDENSENTFLPFLKTGINEVFYR